MPGRNGVYLNKHYEPVGYVQTSNGSEDFDMHEFNTIDRGTSELVISSVPAIRNGLKVLDNGFLEIDVETGETIFQ